MKKLILKKKARTISKDWYRIYHRGMIKLVIQEKSWLNKSIYHSLPLEKRIKKVCISVNHRLQKLMSQVKIGHYHQLQNNSVLERNLRATQKPYQVLRDF